MTRRAVAPATLSARIADHVALEAQPNGEIAARFYGHSVALGKFSAAASHRAQARCRAARHAMLESIIVHCAKLCGRQHDLEPLLPRQTSAAAALASSVFGT